MIPTQIQLTAEVLYHFFQQMPEEEQRRFWSLLRPKPAPLNGKKQANTVQLIENIKINGIPDLEPMEDIREKYGLKLKDLAPLKGIFDDIDMTTDEIIEAMDD